MKPFFQNSAPNSPNTKILKTQQLYYFDTMLEIKSDGIVFKKLSGDTEEYYIHTDSGDTNLNVNLENKIITNLTIHNLKS